MVRISSGPWLIADPNRVIVEGPEGLAKQDGEAFCRYREDCQEQAEFVRVCVHGVLNEYPAPPAPKSAI